MFKTGKIMTKTHSWQTYVAHPLTALVFAWATWRFVDHYQLLEFFAAPLAAAGVVGVAYLFLSRRYDPILSIIFLVMALFSGFQAHQIPAKMHVQQESVEEQIKSKLLVLSAAKKWALQKNQVVPALSEDEAQHGCGKQVQFFDCDSAPCHYQNEKPLYQALYLKERGHLELWSVDEQFQVSNETLANNVQNQPDL